MHTAIYRSRFKTLALKISDVASRTFMRNADSNGRLGGKAKSRAKAKTLRSQRDPWLNRQDPECVKCMSIEHLKISIIATL